MEETQGASPYTNKVPQQRRTWLALLALLCLLSQGVGVQCTCQGEPTEGPTTQIERFTLPDTGVQDTPDEFQCVDLINKPCQQDADCEPEQPPPPEKTLCPQSYCDRVNSHDRNLPTNPSKPGTFPWDRNYYPPSTDCACQISCPIYKCIQGICKIPEEPVPDLPPVDLRPTCPATCTQNSDCPKELCGDNNICDTTKKICINEFVKP